MLSLREYCGYEIIEVIVIRQNILSGEFSFAFSEYQLFHFMQSEFCLWKEERLKALF